MLLTSPVRAVRDRPIGVFDSGLGGLTVAHEIARRLPAERILYLGDTARVPYGTRSAETVVRYARACARFLVARGIKALVVACNTVSAVALDALRVDFDLPVLGVIEPGARAAARVSRTGRIGVLGTAGTIDSQAYPRAIAAADSRCETFAQAAPLFVPLAEEGWIEGEVPIAIAERYIEPLVRARVDTLVLGCTHYPLLVTAIACALGRLGAKGDDVRIIDSAETTAAALAALLEERGLGCDLGGPGGMELFVTDRPRRFDEVAGRFLGSKVPAAQLVDL